MVNVFRVLGRYVPAVFLVAVILTPSLGVSQELQTRGRLGMLAENGFRPELNLLSPPTIPSFAIGTLKLSPIKLSIQSFGGIKVDRVPPATSSYSGKIVGINAEENLVVYTLDENLQAFADNILKKVRSPYAAIVAMDPLTGKVLSISSKSNSKTIESSVHSGFLAASLFKVVTAAAALEMNRIAPDQRIYYRGGTYSLNKWNINPDPRKDRQSMPVDEALGRSCNAVFARIALQYLDPSILKRYARSFGFNNDLPFDMDLVPSYAEIPFSTFELGRTAAGFGEVSISPVHAAALMSGIANGGFLPRPTLVEKVVNKFGKTIYSHKSEIIHRMIKPQTAQTLLDMMRATVTKGTSKKEFYWKGIPKLPGITVAAKTGTLSGDNPKGVNRWFIAAAPVEDPKIALAIIVVDPSRPAYSPSRLGLMMLKEFFGV